MASWIIIIAVLTAIMSQSLSVEYPEIKICTNATDSRNCDGNQTISITKFEFGRLQNILHITNVTSNDQYSWLRLRCQASYPVRWITQGQQSQRRQFRGRIRLLTESVLRFEQSPLENTENSTYSQDILLPENIRERDKNRDRGSYFRGKDSRILRCESFSDSSLFSEVYYNPTSIGEASTMFYGSSETTNYFVVDPIMTDSYIVPCALKEVNVTAQDIKLVEIDRQSQVTSEVSQPCIDCICYAISNCTTMPCQHCGEISKAFWEDAWKNTTTNVSDDNAYQKCALNITCIHETIRRYTANHGQDCDGDGVLTCEDFARIHLYGAMQDECKKDLVSGNAEFAMKFRSCWNGENPKFITTTSDSYDPRIGFQIMGEPSLRSTYKCIYSNSSALNATKVANTSVIHFAPLRAEDELPSVLNYNTSDGLFHCNTVTNEIISGVNLTFYICDNITDCDIKHLPIRALKSLMTFPVTDGSSVQIGDLDKTKTSLTLNPVITQGFVQCSGVLKNQSGSEGMKFVKQIDYMFTGINKNRYLTSMSYPLEAIISVVAEENSQDKYQENQQYSFECKISTFVLLPNIRFGVGFSDGKTVVIDNTNKDKSALGAKIVQVVTDSNSIMESHLRLTLSKDIQKVFCFAPWINSTEWVRSEIPVEVIPAGAGAGAIAGYVFAFLAIIVLLIAAAIVLVKKIKPVRDRLPIIKRFQ